MNTLTNHIATRPIQTIFKLACVAAILAGCGGGGSGGTTSTSSFASGPISGFGSVIVNGVRFDDSSAKVSSDDDDNNEVHNRSELKLGMVVEIQGGGTTSDDSGRHGRANEIQFGSELVGPVGATIDVAGKSFTVLGQTVKVTDTTIFDSSIAAGITALKSGDVLEIHGLRDANNVITATRIEPKVAPAFFKIRGTVQSVDTTLLTFVIGGETISYGSLTPVPVKDQVLRVKVQTTKVNGAWVAIKIKSGVHKVEDHDEAEIKGSITEFTSKTNFKVNGIAVDATGVANLPSGLAMGVMVEVEGKASNGTIVATKVEIEDKNNAAANEFEFHRRIATANAGAKTFVIDTTTISWDDSTVFEKGATSLSLTANTCVEVKATAMSGSTTLHATRIKLDNTCTQ